MLVVGISLLAAICWGVSDFSGGLFSRRLSVVVVMLVMQAAGVVIAAAIIVAAGEGVPGTRTIALAATAGAAGALALGAFYRALAIGTMSIVAPISASGVTLPVVVGIVSGDRPSSVQAAGLVLTAVGVVLAGREVHEGERVPGARASVGLAIVAGLGFGSFFALSDAASDGSVLWMLVVSRLTALVLYGAVAAVRRPRTRPSARDLAALVPIGALDLVATGLYGIANRQGLLSIVAVVGSLYPVTTVLLARVVLKERLATVQAAGVVLAFGGVAAVAGG